MRRFKKINPPLSPAKTNFSIAPKVSILVPARNEEKNIKPCVSQLLNQGYPNIEIIVINDRSTDNTRSIVESIQKQTSKILKIVDIKSLPTGWTGKNNAMYEGAKKAAGEWLLFTDADTFHKSFSVESAMKTVLDQKIDFLTLAPEVLCKSFWENTVQPLVISSLALWFQSEKVNDPNATVTLANGQFILVKKDIYEAVNGNASVKNEVIEDVELAKKIKEAGFKVRFLNGTQLYSTRMYSCLKEILTGWTRIFTYLFEKNIFRICLKIMSLLVFSISPFVILFMSAVQPGLFNHTVLGISLGLCAYILIIRFIGNRMLRSNPWFGLLHPLGCIVAIVILLKCIARILFNRPSVWRGDYYR